MKLIQQKILYFKQGTSDKVYEIDLCELNHDSYVVNFRYGRRNGNLKDGSKTIIPVTEKEARKIFADLVKSKVKKGYSESLDSFTESYEQSEQALDQQEKIQAPKTSDPRDQAILNRLRDGHNSNSKWTLERVVWKAGEFQLAEAPKLMVGYLGQRGMLDYSILWAFGRCGESMVLPYIKRIIQKDTFYKDFDNKAIRRIAFSSAITLSSGFDLSFYKSELIKELPANLQEAVKNEAEEYLGHLLNSIPDQPDTGTLEVLEKLYLIDPPGYKKWLLNFLRTVPFKPTFFQFAKHIYKLSEQLLDTDCFGLLSIRFETEKPYYNSPEYYWGDSFSTFLPDHGYSTIKFKDLKSKNPPVCFSSKTKSYLRKRTWRVLERLGTKKSRYYVRMAVSVIRELKSEHGREPWKTTSWEYTGRFNYKEISVWHDRFSQFKLINYILFGNSARYKLANNRKKFICVDWKPGDSLPVQREELYPELWDECPELLIDLLTESDVEEVHTFAVKILKEHPDKLTALEEEAVVALLSSPFKITADLALDIAIKMLFENKSALILKALLDSEHSDQRDAALRFIKQCKAELAVNIEILTVCYGCKSDQSRNLCEEELSSWGLSVEVMHKVLLNLIDWCQESQEQKYRASLSDIINKSFGHIAKLIDLKFIAQLFDHEYLEVQEIAASLLAGHGLSSKDLPPDLLLKLLHSESQSLRESGLRMMSQFNDSELLERQELILNLLTHELDDMRQNAQPVFIRLCSASVTQAPELINRLLAILIRGRVKKEILAELSQFMIINLDQHLKKTPKERIKKLLTVKVPAANQVGGHLMPLLNSEDFSNKELSHMLNNETASIRASASKILQNSNRIKEEPMAFVSALDSEWEDTQEFIFEMFNSIGETLNSDTLIAICDSTQEKVQRFGRKLLMANFKNEDGLQYIMQLSEHPSQNLQLFVSTFLESELTGKPHKISELLPFIVNCLTRVNKGRVIKQRLFIFLENEALKNKDIAGLIQPVIYELSATCGVELKAVCLSIMVKIRSKWGVIEEVTHGV